MSASNLHMAWARLLLRSLARSGVRDVVVSPGSRSTPLALAAHEASDLRSRFVLDERSAAFFALGQARVTGRPTALVCTSGTAAAHYYPAVVEAFASAIPLVAITADRPWELQNAGAQQTIDQTRLFGAFARGCFALGAPEPSDGALRALVRTAAQAVARATGPIAGPVQINAPFRKPLEPVAEPSHEAWTATWEALMQAGPTRSIAPSGFLDPSAFEECAELVARAERGIIVCGPAPAHGDLESHRREIVALARLTGFPVLAEATSQVRFGLPASGAPVIGCFDAILRSPALRARLAPDVILEIGAPPTSSGYAQLLADHPRCPRIVVASPGWTDPTSTATSILHTDLTAFRAALRVHLTGLSEGRGAAWSRALGAAEARARAAIEESLALDLTTPADLAGAADRTRDGATPADLAGAAERSRGGATSLSEAAVARIVIEACPPGSTLALGNSSPVRDVDAYCAPSSKPIRVLHQRGASGIDGLVSGAAGALAASGVAVTLLLGDLSFLHDVGGLAVARQAASGAAAPLAIVVVNNGGGRIFEQLPIGRAIDAETFERCFATPEPVDLAHAAAAFGLAFERAATPQDLARALDRAHARHGATIVEAVVPTHEGARRLRDLWNRTARIPPPRDSEIPIIGADPARKDEPS